MTVDALDDDTTWKYRRQPAWGAAMSAAIHVAVAVALLPVMLQQPPRLSEREIPVLLELPSTAAVALPGGDAPQAARRLPAGPPQTSAVAAAPTLASEDLAAAPTRPPVEPDVALIAPAVEPPPPVTSEEIGSAAPPPAPLPALDRLLPAVDAPPLVSGAEFAMTAPPATASSLNLQSHAEAPSTPQPVQKATPRRAAVQKSPVGTARHPGRPAVAVRGDAAAREPEHRVHRDYLMQVVQRISQTRFHDRTRDDDDSGLVVARLALARDGRLIELALVRPSGHPGRDRGIVQAIRGAAPFPPVPTEIAAEPYILTIPIGYALEP